MKLKCVFVRPFLSFLILYSVERQDGFAQFCPDTIIPRCIQTLYPNKPRKHSGGRSDFRGSSQRC